MRTQQESDKTTKRVHLGQAGSFLIQGDLAAAVEPVRDVGKPVLVLVGKRLPSTDAAGNPISIVYTSPR